MRGLVLILALLVPVAWTAAAQGLPALHSVTGVAANDVLNVRAAPDAGAAIVAAIPPYTAAIEVVAISPDGKWALVNAGERAGWVALRFLLRTPGPDWTALQTPIACYGTEPFWSLTIDPAAGQARFNAPDADDRSLSLDWGALVIGTQRTVGVHLTNAGAPAFATITGDACNDGMSDREFGLSITFFETSETGSNGYAGCCSVEP